MLTEGLEDSPCRDWQAQPHVPVVGEPTATCPAPSSSRERVLTGARAGWSREMPVPRILPAGDGFGITVLGSPDTEGRDGGRGHPQQQSCSRTQQRLHTSSHSPGLFSCK